MADQLTDEKLIERLLRLSAESSRANTLPYGGADVVLAVAARLEAVIAERDDARKDGDDDLRWRKYWAERAEAVKRERDAEKARADEAEARLGIAEDLLKRVVIHGGSGSWTWREMYDWCCDYKDWSNGHGRESYERPHDNCGHRKRPGTDCGAIGAGDSDEPVHHLFGPDGLWTRAEAAEARVAELEGAALADQMALDEKRQLLADLHGLTADGDLWAKLIRQRDEARERVAELEAGTDGEDLGALSEEKPWLARSEVAPSAPPSAEAPHAGGEGGEGVR